MAVTKEELEALSTNFCEENIDRMLSAGLLTFPRFLSASRNIMSNSFQVQRVIPVKPEFPRIYTGYENAFGEYADSLTKAEANFKVIDVICKFPNAPRHIYIYIVQNMLTGQYDVIEIKHYEKYSESHGYIKPQTQGDTKMPGSFIKAGEILASSPSHDEYGNYAYGVNAKVAYMAIPEVEEDGFVISDEFAEKHKIYQMEQESTLVNTNTVLLNIYGDKNEYKCFPDIGEDVKDGIVCSRRQVNYAYAASELTQESLLKIIDGDKNIYGEGRIVDIEVFVNNEEELINNANRSQILQYWVISKLYHQNIVKSLEKIIKNKSAIYSYRLKLMYERSKDFLNQDMKFASSNGIFEFALINFTICKEDSMGYGYKLCDRHGSKGVVTHILPKEYMPRDVWGNVADVIQSPPGIVARANPAQSYEHELNFIADNIRRQMTTVSGIRRQFAILHDFIQILDKDQAEELSTRFNSQNEYSQAEYLLDIIQNGLHIRMPPFGQDNLLDKFEKLYTKYKIKPYPVRVKREFKYKGERKNHLTKYDQDSYFAFLKNAKQEDILVNQITPLDSIDNSDIDQDLSDEEFLFKNEFYIGKDNDSIYKIAPNKKNQWTKTEAVDNRTLYDIAIDTWSDETIIEYKDDCVVRSFMTTKPVIVAEKFMMILKHVPDGKLSSRFIGTTNPLGLPNKTTKTEVKGPVSETPIKFGEMELFNAILRIDPKIVYEHLSLVAKNPELRSKLFKICLFDDPLEYHDLDVSEEELYDDIPAKEFKAYLFCLGFEIINNEKDDIYSAFDNIELSTEEIVKVVEAKRDLRLLANKAS